MSGYKLRIHRSGYGVSITVWQTVLVLKVLVLKVQSVIPRESPIESEFYGRNTCTCPAFLDDARPPPTDPLGDASRRMKHAR
eukprot:974009-Prorocentrum_minimum.AAC.1